MIINSSFKIEGTVMDRFCLIITKKLFSKEQFCAYKNKFSKDMEYCRERTIKLGLKNLL